MNKKGLLGEQLMIFPFLFFLVIIGVGIVGGVLLFFGGEYDYRSVDASVLNYKIRECLVEEDIDFSLEGEDFEKDIYEKCLIDKNALVSHNLFFRICRDSENCFLDDNPLISMGSNYQSCEFEGVKDNNAFPKCKKGSVFVEGMRYDVISGSNQKAIGRRMGL